VVRSRARELLAAIRESDGGRRSIVNLGHGIHRDTPPETVSALCEEIVRYV